MEPVCSKIPQNTSASNCMQPHLAVLPASAIIAQVPWALHAMRTRLSRAPSSRLLVEEIVAADPAEDGNIPLPDERQPIAHGYAHFPDGASERVPATLQMFDAQRRVMWIFRQ